jgi:hypothetical protein
MCMQNEALAKILCHNLCVVIQEWYDLGIDPRDSGITVRGRPWVAIAVRGRYALLHVRRHPHPVRHRGR